MSCSLLKRRRLEQCCVCDRLPTDICLHGVALGMLTWAPFPLQAPLSLSPFVNDCQAVC